MKTFLLELRDTAKLCSNEEWRTVLRAAADNLECDIEHFAAFPTADALIAVNGSWALAGRIQALVPAEGDPQPPSSGDIEPARLAA